MTNPKIDMLQELSTLRLNMNDEIFMRLWPKCYPDHVYGGYDEEQLAIWNTNPFYFVLKWPIFVDYAINQTAPKA